MVKVCTAHIADASCAREWKNVSSLSNPAGRGSSKREYRAPWLTSRKTRLCFFRCVYEHSNSTIFGCLSSERRLQLYNSFASRLHRL